MVINGLPMNPQGRTGMRGRGPYYYWGPNHMFELVITRLKQDINGNQLHDANNKKVIEFLSIQDSLDNRKWHLPKVSRGFFNFNALNVY